MTIVKDLRWWEWISVAIWLPLILFTGAMWLGPKLDGALFPVVTRLLVFDVREYDDTSKFKSSAEKLRACSWIETRWYLGRRGGLAVPVTIEYNAPPQLNDVGALEWPKTTVGLSPANLLANSYADVVHDCYNGWAWLTVTPFFEGVTE